jgi:hypothetical protein
MRKICRILVGKVWRKRPLGRLSVGGKLILKLDLRKWVMRG